MGMSALETTRNTYIFILPDVAECIGPRSQLLFKVSRTDGTSHTWGTFDVREAVNEELTHFSRNPNPICNVELVPDVEEVFYRKHA